MFEGKIANQSPYYTLNSGNPRPKCIKCSKLIDKPLELKISTFESAEQRHTIGYKDFAAFHYIDKKFFIYETKGGNAVVYCSVYCRNKHNHRFNKRQPKKFERQFIIRKYGLIEYFKHLLGY
jgi:hypothetical protein